MASIWVVALPLIPVVATMMVGRAQVAEDHTPIPAGEDGELDFTSCLTCHVDTNQGTSVHPALEFGCETCHAVDQDEDYTEIFLPSTGNDLCLTCHSDKDASSGGQITVHQPVQRDNCLTCHDPHHSDSEFLLRKPREGTDAESNLCLTCHTNIAEQVNKENLHAAVEFGCATCHETHKFEAEDEQEATYHLVTPAPDLCMTCHDIENEEFSTAHSGQPVETARCTMCHNPHGSDNDKLLNNFIHPAFEFGCETCHEQPADGQVVLQEGARKDLCLMCHSDVAEAIADVEFSHFPVELDDGCVNCHNPHVTTYAKLLKAGPVRTCFACHTERQEERAGKDRLHKPVFEIGCNICHIPHGTDRASLLRTDVKDLCLECHNRDMVGTLRMGEDPVELFDGKKSVPLALLADIPMLPVRKSDTFGHPLSGHPFSGKYKKPNGKKDEEIDIDCMSCHLPHAADETGFLLRHEARSNLKLCGKCH